MMNTIVARSTATRPLNSYMAFRTHYKVLFDNIPQKEISGLLSFLWEHDKDKPKWTVLAKAYSIIRDVVGKKNAPLDVFLCITGPFVGIIAPAGYLTFLGWEIEVNNEEQLYLVQKPISTNGAVSVTLPNSSCSIIDVIKFSIQSGYVAAGVMEPINKGKISGLFDFINPEKTKVPDLMKNDVTQTVHNAPVVDGKDVTAMNTLETKTDKVATATGAVNADGVVNIGDFVEVETDKTIAYPGADNADAAITKRIDHTNVGTAATEPDLSNTMDIALMMEDLDNPAYDLDSSRYPVLGVWPYDEDFFSGQDEFDPYATGNAFNTYNIFDFDSYGLNGTMMPEL